MVTRRRLYILLIIFILSIPLAGSCRALSLPDFAILSQIQGKINAGTEKKMAEGTNGMLLSQRNRVKTEKNGKVTVLVKDGSKIRLFSDSELIIGAKKRLKEVTRLANHQLDVLELGSKIQSQVKGDMDKTLETRWQLKFQGGGS